jgi:hypothetical protein
MMLYRNTDSTITQETFEAANSLFDQGFELASVTWNDTTIEANVNPAFTLGRFNLDLEVFYSSSGRYGIQWHVNDGSDTAKGSSPSTSPKAFPFCSAGFVKMDVSIYETRKEYMRRVVCV